MKHIIFDINDSRVSWRLGAVRSNLSTGDFVTVYLAEFTFGDADKYRALGHAFVKRAEDSVVELVIDPEEIRSDWSVGREYGEEFDQVEREHRYSALMAHPEVRVTFGQE